MVGRATDQTHRAVGTARDRGRVPRGSVGHSSADRGSQYPARRPFWTRLPSLLACQRPRNTAGREASPQEVTPRPGIARGGRAGSTAPRPGLLGGRHAGPPDRRRRGRHGVGVDLLPERIERGHDRWPALDLQVADARHLPFGAGSLDAILAMTVFRPVPIPARAAITAEIAGVLRPGGVFVWYDLRRETRPTPT